MILGIRTRFQQAQHIIFAESFSSTTVVQVHVHELQGNGDLLISSSAMIKVELDSYIADFRCVLAYCTAPSG